MDADRQSMDPVIVDELSRRLLNIALEVIGDDLTTMIIKGSAIKGDFIPDFSDFDVHLFARDSVMRGPLIPRRSIAIPFQERFSAIDVPSYRVSEIQVMIISEQHHPPEWIPPLPGTFQLVYGQLPDTLPEVTSELLRNRALNGLRRCNQWVDSILARIVDKPDHQLAASVRLAGVILKASLYEAAITLGTPPMETWQWPLRDILDEIEPRIMPHRPASRYFERARYWAEIREHGPELRAMLGDGVEALEILGSVAEQRS